MSFELENLDISREIINDDHIEFVHIIKYFFESFNKNVNDEVYLDLLDQLETYAIAHFQTEEKYYRMFHYPNIELKIIKNDLLLDKIEEYRKNFLELKVDSRGLIEFLFNWIITHFKEHDIKFDNFLEENSLDFLFHLDMQNDLTI